MFSNTMIMAPETPQSTCRYTNYYATKPHKSSPLAEQLSSPISESSSSFGVVSPISEAQARRRAQYKSSISSSHASSSRSSSSSRVSIPPFKLEEPPQKTLMRQRLKAHCVERVRRAKERSVRSRRWASSDASSDGVDADVDMDIDDEQGETDDQLLNDEIFHRIILNDKRKKIYEHRLSYEYDIGSSLDPDMEDVSSWEAELRTAEIPVPSSTPTITAEDEPPEDLDIDDDELATLYDQYVEAHNNSDLRDELDDITEEMLNAMFEDDEDLKMS